MVAAINPSTSRANAANCGDSTMRNKLTGTLAATCRRGDSFLAATWPVVVNTRVIGQQLAAAAKLSAKGQTVSNSGLAKVRSRCALAAFADQKLLTPPKTAMSHEMPSLYATP